MENLVIENLQKSLKVLVAIVMICIFTIISRNAFALDNEKRIPVTVELTADNQTLNWSLL